MNKKETMTMTWNPETKESTVTIINPDNGHLIIGTAKCHPDDNDMASEKTGLALAEMRALVNLYKDKCKMLKHEKKLFLDLYNTYKLMPNFDPKEAHIRVLGKRIISLEEDIKFTKKVIKDTNKDIAAYINLKDKLYLKLRMNRIGNTN